MNNTIKWTLVVCTVVAMISGIAIKRHDAANTLSSSIFKFYPEHGYVVPIPQKQASFMGLPMFLAISSGFGAQGGPAIEDLNRATKALSVLSQCVQTAEHQLIGLEKERGITASDIQNPHVWIEPGDEEKTRWTIVVEAKDREGFAWHIEFKDAEFYDIWAGS